MRSRDVSSLEEVILDYSVKPSCHNYIQTHGGPASYILLEQTVLLHCNNADFSFQVADISRVVMVTVRQESH